MQGVSEGDDQASASVITVGARLAYAMIGGGAGSFIGPVHRAALRLDNLADPVAGCFSRDAAVNAETGKVLGVEPSRTYPDWRSLIDSEKGRIDFLCICSPNDTHYPVARYALEAGINVMCEKPLSMTSTQARELEELSRIKNLVLAVPFTYSGYAMVKVARELVKKGELGKICKVVVEYQQGSFRKVDFSKPLDRRNSWKMDPARSGPSCVVADIGVHAMHIAEYVTGLQVNTVSADLSSFAPGNVLEDDATVMLRFSGGAKGVVVASKVATGEENGLRLRVYGDKASLHWEVESGNYLKVKYAFEPERIYKRNAPYVKEGFDSAARCSRLPAGHHEGFIEALANHYREFCAAVRGVKGCDFPGAEEGRRTMEFVDAVLASGKAGGGWIPLRT